MALTQRVDQTRSGLFLSLCAHVLHVTWRREQLNSEETARSHIRNFLLRNRFFLQKDVAESAEARKVTPSFYG
jgi:hypothetical protein